MALELGNWVPVQLTFVAPSALTTLRLHFNKEGAYFDRVVMDTHIKGSPFKITTTSSYENSVARGTDGRKGTSASGAGLSGSTAGKASGKSAGKRLAEGTEERGRSLRQRTDWWSSWSWGPSGGGWDSHGGDWSSRRW